MQPMVACSLLTCYLRLQIPAEEIMTNPAGEQASDYNTQIINEFRANQGCVGGMWTGTSLILIHHIGARSGIERVTPVACSSQGQGRYAIWAANGGSPAHPNWYYNLKAHPRITVEAGAQTFTVLAEELDGAARAELWPRLVAEWPKPAAGSPDLGAAQARTTRQFPVFLLTRQD
jgi:deazaflavin-dependent oxidoreductase (nitroreductase family)